MILHGALLLAFVALMVYMAAGITPYGWRLPITARVARKQVEKRNDAERLRRYQRDGEPFRALCECPKCTALEVHWIEIRSRFAIPRDGSIRRHCRTCGFTWKQN